MTHKTLVKHGLTEFKFRRNEKPLEDNPGTSFMNYRIAGLTPPTADYWPIFCSNQIEYLRLEEVKKSRTGFKVMVSSSLPVDVREAVAMYTARRAVAEQEKKAARKERMHKVVGMWAHLEKDSVELQKELREDWS